jgi:hypothetical protein
MRQTQTQKQPIDPTKSPWMSWHEGNRTVTVCKHCLQHYNKYAEYESDNHFDWCKWWDAYVKWDDEQREP